MDPVSPAPDFILAKFLIFSLIFEWKLWTGVHIADSDNLLHEQSGEILCRENITDFVIFLV